MLKLEQLNTAQKQAVLYGEGPLLVLAGPGSGKTFTITQRIFYLLEKLQAAPEEILVITFTKDAALSMQKRFTESSHQSYPVNFGTFHSIFYHILRASGNFGNGQILTEEQKRKLIIPLLQKQQNTYCEKAKLAEDAAAFVSAISYYKNTSNEKGACEKLSAEWQQSFPAIYEEYEQHRKRQRALDFDDMVGECEELLQGNAEQRAYWQKRFRFILIDEFQDINPKQYQVIRLLSMPPYNLFAVGDDDQAIYGFRGSNPACLQKFVADYHAEQLLLDVNYRSDRAIVQNSLLVIADNKERFPKSLKPFSQNPGKVTLHSFPEREEEYQYLISLLSQADKKSSYAVLFRTNSYMQGFAARLRQTGISFEMKETKSSIYEHFLVQDIMAYLRIASGEQQKRLWLQILNKPSRYISREAFAGTDYADIATLQAYYQRQPVTAADFSYREKIQAAVSLLAKQLAYLGKLPPYLGVQYVWKAMGYEQYLHKEWGRSRQQGENMGVSPKTDTPIPPKQEEWKELYYFLREDARHYATVAQWLEAQEAYKETLQSKKEPQKQSPLQLMTVHASKGLEFDYVIIPDCNEKIFPHGTMPDASAVEEERRIFYVAMTRAKKGLELLYLTGTKERPRQPSRFLNPLLK